MKSKLLCYEVKKHEWLSGTVEPTHFSKKS